jgi:leucyl aminopeptidase
LPNDIACSTDHPDLGFSNLFAPGGPKNAFEYPSPSKVNSTTHEYIESLFPSISTTSMKEFLKTFSSFRTRYYKSSTGAESSEWLFNQVKDVAKLNKKAKVEVKHFEHPWGQGSVIAKIPAAGGKGLKEKSVVVVGAHQDSANMWPFLPAPGGE